MTISSILDKTKIQKIGKTPVVVLPLDVWQKLESALEEYQTISSLSYLKSIKESRKQIKVRKLYEFNIRTGKFKKINKVK